MRLAGLLLLNAAVLAAAWFAARRWASDPVQRLLDTLLLWYAIQYAAVCVPGVLHVLSPWTMAIVTLLISAGLFGLSRVMGGPPMSSEPKTTGGPPVTRISDRGIYFIAALFVTALIGCVVFLQAYTPVIDSDAVTYHVPIAVHWLQTGRLDLLPVWFFNPANTFSPLAGSTFMVWLLAPLGNDVLARMAQAPAAMLLFLAALQLGRAVGLPGVVAAFLAVAVAVSRPFNSELTSARDDIFLAAFVAVAVAGCGREALRDRFGPWRIGLAIGLAAATKYTFFIAVPVLLLLIDAPFQAGWNRRRWAIALATAILIAGPWYARNWLLTGNPLYPIDLKILGHSVLHGLFDMQPSARLRTWQGLRSIFIADFHGLPPALLALLVIGWAAAVMGWIGRARRNPLIRACLFGMPLCVAFFVAKAPYGEVRFLFPALVPLFVAVGLAIHRWLPWPTAKGIAAAVMAIAALWTSYNATILVAQLAGIAALVTLAGIGLVWGYHHLGDARQKASAHLAVAAVAGLAMWIFVSWKAYLRDYRGSQRIYWGMNYPKSAPAWQFLSDNVPPDATIAYTNTYWIYPLYGFPPTRKLLYIPVRSDIPDFLHLPQFPEPLPGEKIESTFTHLLNASPDAVTWRQRLLQSGATYLFIARTGPALEVPELAFAQNDPLHFTRIFRDEGAAIYEVRR